MQAKILAFISALRENNIKVSLAESQDSMNAILISPDLILDQHLFRQTLQCTLIKDTAQIDTFNFLFDLFFLKQDLKYADFIRGMKAKELQAKRQALRTAVDGDGDPGEGGHGAAAPKTEALYQLLKEAESEESLHPLTKSLMTGNIAHWENLVDEKVNLLRQKWASRPLRRQATYERHLLESFDWFEIHSELDRIYYQAAMQGMDVQELIDRVEAHRKRFKELMKRTIQYTEVEPQGHPRRDLPEEKLYEAQRLRRVPFETLSPEEMKSLAYYAQRVAQILATKISRRQKLSKRQSQIDFRNTVRRSVGFGGIPVELIYRKRKIKKHDVVLICDVSGSVIKSARFLLQFIYSIQQCMLGKIKSFIFVSKIDEITTFFQGREVKEAINLAMSSAEIDYYGKSDFGAAFYEFSKKYLESVNSKTIVIIIGDARNNNKLSQVGKLQEIRNKAKRLIWLNPEAKNQWNTGDSIMNEYGKCAHEVHEVMNFETLAKFVEELMV